MRSTLGTERNDPRLLGLTELGPQSKATLRDNERLAAAEAGRENPGREPDAALLARALLLYCWR